MVSRWDLPVARWLFQEANPEIECKVEDVY